MKMCQLNAQRLFVSGLRFRIRAFTLVELIVVVAILGILAAILFPVVNGAIDRSRAATCAGNLRAIGAGLSLWVQENNNQLPNFRRWPEQLITGGYAPAKAFICPDFQGNINFPQDYNISIGGAPFTTAGYGMNAMGVTAAPGSEWGSPSSDIFPSGLPNIARSLYSVAEPSKTIWVMDYTMDLNNKKGISWISAGTSFFPTLLANFAKPGSQHNLSFRHGNVANVLYVDGHVEAVKGTEESIQKHLGPKFWNIYQTAP